MLGSEGKGEHGEGGLARTEILTLRLSLELLSAAELRVTTERRIWPSPLIPAPLSDSCSNILAPRSGVPSELGTRSWDFRMSLAPPQPGFLEQAPLWL